MKKNLLIVVPTLNSYTLLPRLIRSLQQQTWKDWRLLFVDGLSDSKHRQWLIDCCFADDRFSWVEQLPDFIGIFGAMNQGFSMAAPGECVLFWGSDDWAASPHCFDVAMSAFNAAGQLPDLLVCRGRYADSRTQVLGRTTRFQSSGALDSFAFSRALLTGCTPPHQATIFAPGAIAKLDHYSSGFRLSADLDYFLKLSCFPDLRVICLDLELVHMADAGISSQQPLRRLQEVCRAYRRSHGWVWWFPFFARYFRRFFSLVPVF